MLPTVLERKSGAFTTLWAPVHLGGTTSANERHPSDADVGMARLGVETARSRASTFESDLIASYDGRQGLWRARGGGRPSGRGRPSALCARVSLKDTRMGKGLTLINIPYLTCTSRNT